MPQNDTTDLMRPGFETDRSKKSAERSTSTRAVVADSVEPLVEIRRSETIADRTDFDALRRKLPMEWDVLPDLVQFGAEPLAETVLFRRGQSGPRIVLKPARSDEPTNNIELYERGGPRATRQPTMTVETLSEALRVALNRVHTLDRNRNAV